MRSAQGGLHQDLQWSGVSHPPQPWVQTVTRPVCQHARTRPQGFAVERVTSRAWLIVPTRTLSGACHHELPPHEVASPMMKQADLDVLEADRDGLSLNAGHVFGAQCMLHEVA